MKDWKGKLKTASGFSLAETLMAIIILLLVSAIVATGIPVAKNAYEKVVLAANAEVLLSTAELSLRNELGTASDITISETTITYYSARRSTYSVLARNPEEDGVAGAPAGSIILTRYYNPEGLGSTAPEALIQSSSSRSVKDLYVTYTGVTYNKTTGIVQFSGLSVWRDGAELVKRGSEGILSIRVISA